MTAWNRIGILACVGALIIGSGLALKLSSQGTPPDATAGYSETASNGMLTPTDFAEALDSFKEVDDAQKGLGPTYNATSCVDCHQNPVTGGNSQIAELRVGHRDRLGHFVNPTILINRGQTSIPGRSLVNDRAVCPEAQEHAPQTENIRAFRMTLSILGDGFVEAIADGTLKDIAAKQPSMSGGKIAGQVIMVPVAESGQLRVGRFGWKDQQASLLSFAGDAYLNEQGITSRLNPTDMTSVCDGHTSDPEDDEDIDVFANFMRATMAPPVDTVSMNTPDAQAGARVFTQVGCSICHVPSITTAAAGTDINGDGYTIPDTLGNKTIRPYGDFLLHNVGTGDGIVQNGGETTANKVRTVPLWGLRTRDRFMHDGLSITLQNAISRHAGEASGVAKNYFKLSNKQRAQLITFLNAL
jgi:CxxC motif-containing protein (DUF1111 family)